MGIKEGAKRRKQLADRMEAIRGLVPLPKSERHKFNITDVKEGWYIHYNDNDFFVESIGRYQEYNWKLTKKKDFECFELGLLCLSSGSRLSIEWEKDDHVEVSLTLREINMRSISHHSSGVIYSGSDYENVCEQRSAVLQDGKKYHYDDDWAAMYYRNNDDEGVRVRFYDFESDDGHTLTVEEWLDGPPKDSNTEFEYEAFLAKPIDPDEIEILGVNKGSVV